MGRPVNRDYGSRQRSRVVNRDYEHYEMNFPIQGPYTERMTDSGTIVDAPTITDQYICVTSIWLSNNDSSSIRIELTNGQGGDPGFAGRLAADGGGVVMRFTPPWQLAPETALYVNFAEGAGDVDVNVNYFVE